MTGRPRPLMVAVVALAVLTGSCTGDDDAAPTSSTTTASETRATTSTLDGSTTTQPVGTDLDAVQPVLEDLIDRYDAAVAAVLADPRVADDRETAEVLAYLALFTSDSSFADTALEFWAAEGAQGRFYRPGPRGQMYKSEIRSVEPASADEVTVSVCSVTSIVIVDEAGTEISAEGGRNAGSVVAVRVDGVWRIRDLTRTPSTDCPDRSEL